MADIEERVGKLEKDVEAIKAQAARHEATTQRHEAELINIPELIKIEFRLANSRFVRLDQGLNDLRADFDTMKLQLGAMEKRLQQQIDTLPRAVAEIVTQMLDERDRRTRQ